MGIAQRLFRKRRSLTAVGIIEKSCNSSIEEGLANLGMEEIDDHER